MSVSLIEIDDELKEHIDSKLTDTEVEVGDKFAIVKMAGKDIKMKKNKFHTLGLVELTFRRMLRSLRRLIL